MGRVKTWGGLVGRVMAAGLVASAPAGLVAAHATSAAARMSLHVMMMTYAGAHRGVSRCVNADLDPDL